jgi:hypothetical protein
MTNGESVWRFRKRGVPSVVPDALVSVGTCWHRSEQPIVACDIGIDLQQKNLQEALDRKIDVRLTQLLTGK